MAESSQLEGRPATVWWKPLSNNSSMYIYMKLMFLEEIILSVLSLVTFDMRSEVRLSVAPIRAKRTGKRFVVIVSDDMTREILQSDARKQFFTKRTTDDR